MAQEHPGRQPLFDDHTGAPLNDAARTIVARAETDAAAGSGSGASSVLASVPDVEIAPGTWKYVAVSLRGRDGETKRIVRSYARLKFHGENYEQAMAPLRPLGINGSVLGGGRIRFDPDAATIHVYGYSKTFGRRAGCNEATARQIEAAFSDAEVTWSDRGY